MKNSEIHNGFDKKEIRDFLAMSLVNLVVQELNNKREPDPAASKSSDMLDWAIKSAENLIGYGQRQVKILNNRRAILSVVKQNGWQEFDVSECTTMDLSEKQFMPFIGTAKEYDTLIKRCTPAEEAPAA